jgi:cell pole-organizing protein PopZ
MDGADDPLVADRDAEPSMRRPAKPTAAAAEEDVLLLSPEMRGDGGHALVSPQAAENSTDVLSQLARAILDRRDMAVAARDVTLESMVREMLRPLLREWLDRNLPYLIERLVKKEIDLMINRAERLED